MDGDEDQAAQDWYDLKSKLMEGLLGKEHDTVMHSVIPYSIGGGLDLYYYPHGISGTAVATKELSELPGQGSANRAYQCYELVMFTRFEIDLSESRNRETGFGRAHLAINRILNSIAPYSADATLNPQETCEFPTEMEDIGGRCLIFDGYPSYNLKKQSEFGLLAIIEVFRSEMDFARKNGGAKLLTLLKKNGVYPYSDMDREPLV